jgi:phosphoglycerol transferase MdoB-like AlkP superfamily enzyme
MFFVESATSSFIKEYDSRPNYLFVEYLRYPRELLATLAGSHLLELIVFNIVAILLFYTVARWTRNDPAGKQRLSLGLCLLASPVFAVVVIMMIRSTLDHRPVNPSIATFSQDSMVNQLALNSPYSLLYAIYEQHRDDRAGQVRYGVMEDQQVIDRMLNDAGIDEHLTHHESSPTWHHQIPSRTLKQPQNLVIILEESLGAEFVSSLGGKHLTPWLDKASAEGIWMERLYATGTRSVRGIEAVLTGFTPTSKRSVVKLRETQKQNRVAAESGPDGARETAVKYADYALGRFFETARESAYWDNTVFLVISDHNSRVYGDQLVPVERFHIPGLIIGGTIKPRKISGITSQIDMLPTLLSLAGVEAGHPGIGRDLTLPEYQLGAGRAILQFYRIAAYLVPGRVVVMQPDLPIQSFLYEPGSQLEPDSEPNAELEKTALAYTLFGPIEIRNRWYPDRVSP